MFTAHFLRVQCSRHKKRRMQIFTFYIFIHFIYTQGRCRGHSVMLVVIIYVFIYLNVTLALWDCGHVTWDTVAPPSSMFEIYYRYTRMVQTASFCSLKSAHPTFFFEIAGFWFWHFYIGCLIYFIILPSNQISISNEASDKPVIMVMLWIWLAQLLFDPSGLSSAGSVRMSFELLDSGGNRKNGRALVVVQILCMSPAKQPCGLSYMSCTCKVYLCVCVSSIFSSHTLRVPINTLMYLCVCCFLSSF